MNNKWIISISLIYKLYECVYLWDRAHPSVLPCAARGDICWCERLWIWCLYAYTASTSTMMHPIIPPATGPTGALLIMFRDATSSSVKERERTRGEERMGILCLKYKGFQPAHEVTTRQYKNSSGSDPNSCCHRDIFCFISILSSVRNAKK